jgi:hypothetical protein
MLTRRRFAAGIAAGASLAGFSTPLSLLAAPTRWGISDDQRQRLLALLPAEDQRFDPFAKMLVASAANGPGYHTTFKAGAVHPTRASLNYAAALLDTGEEARVRRANEILRVVVGLQDKDTASKTFGLWPWYLEEPLAKMSPPDFNWADFCAMPLLMSWMLNRERLVADLVGSIREAIVNATTSIQRRAVAPSDTSIAVLGTGVVLLAAQEFKLPELRAHAKERLQRLHAFILGQGSFAEYNSPTEMVVVLQELARMLWLVKDSRDRSLLSALHDLAWKHVATHFHAPTRQWAGPHSLSDETDLRKRPATLAFLQAAAGKGADLGVSAPLPLSLEAYRIPLECPRKYARLITQLVKPRPVVEVFLKPDASKDGAHNPVVGTTWLHPRFTLGTVNRGDFWTLRRPFLAYWGTASAPRSLRLRFLKDGVDFASALMFSAQHEGDALVAVTLCTDHGDTHPSLVPLLNATIIATDLRLRFEFGAELADCTVRTVGEESKGIAIQDKAVRFIVRPGLGKFGGETTRWEFPELGLAKQFDAVLYSGESKAHDLAKLKEAFLSFAFEEWPYDQRALPELKVEARVNEGRMQARWVTRGRTLELDVPVKPGSFTAMNDAFRGELI